MAHYPATPDTLSSIAEAAKPGDHITLTKGIYGPIELQGVQGPLLIDAEPGVIFDGQRRRQDFDAEANAEAKRLQDADEYPGLYEIAMKAQLILRECRDITLSHLVFRGCWPTGLAIENCQRLTLTGLDFEEGTYAIYASGARTKGLIIENCRFVQDISRNDMWRTIDWRIIHGSQTVLETDVRAFDGDFLRAFGIAGDVVVRNCDIQHAFNGVHIFHADESGGGTDFNHDVRIHDNAFSFIRDNAVEPEWGASNWWVFHNDIRNCHKIFSVECERMGPSYFVGNCYWFDEKPTPGLDHNGGSMWKLHHDVQPGAGMNYVLHNSFFLRSKYIKKERWRDLRHVNNAIQYCAATDHSEGLCDEGQSFFGKLNVANEEKHFTKKWAELNIRFVGDMVAHHQFPDKLMAAGYALEGPHGVSPAFANPQAGDFRLQESSPALGTGEAFDVMLPDGTVWKLPPRSDIGAWQRGQRLRMPAHAYGSPDAGAMV